jgi:hypothetical protein
MGAWATAIMGTPASGTATAAVAALPKKRRRLASGASVFVDGRSCWTWVMDGLLFKRSSAKNYRSVFNYEGHLGFPPK